MMASSDEGTTYLNVSKVLRYSDDNGWSTEAIENQILTVNITLKDECSGNWEIDTVNFETSYTKEIKLEINKMMKYKWVRNFIIYIISCALIIVTVYTEFLNYSQQQFAHSLTRVNSHLIRGYV